MRFVGRISGGVRMLRNRLVRARYFRGHGVHSPFVYGLVREVFMRRTLLPGGRGLYEALLAEGVSERRAVQLQNLMIRCGHATFGMNRADAELCVATCAADAGQLRAMAAAAAAEGRTLVVLAPYVASERMAACRALVAGHRSTSVDNRAYLLLFNNGLPKQHFRI